MVAYANDHHGSYPDGKTSTEVFQKLLDGHYIDDPTIFYHRSIPGKTRATTSTLTVNNVCFDVTSGVTKDSPDGLPVIFSSGYTVTYAPGASAARDPNSPTPFNGDGIALGYISRDHPEYGLACQFSISAPDGSIPKFIPETFDAGGKTYRQLRP
jgi:hypothetical protein